MLIYKKKKKWILQYPEPVLTWSIVLLKPGKQIYGSSLALITMNIDCLVNLISDYITSSGCYACGPRTHLFFKRCPSLYLQPLPHFLPKGDFSRKILLLLNQILFENQLKSYMPKQMKIFCDFSHKILLLNQM